jgi:predicted nucleic acid-binding protein
MWVFDTTPLISLAKIDRLDIVERLDQPCLVPESVYGEVVDDGLDAGYPDVRRIDQRVEDGTLEVVSVAETALAARLLGNDSLSDANVAVLACAADRDAVAVVDETYGRDVAATEGISTRGTAYLVLSQVSQGPIDVSGGREIIDAMIDEGWYCAPDVYTRIVGKLDSFEG